MRARRWSLLGVIAPFAIRIAFMTLFALPALHPVRSGPALASSHAHSAFVAPVAKHRRRIAAPVLTFRSVSNLVSPPSPNASVAAVPLSFASAPPDRASSPEHPPA
jgi:hypothetical protein